MDLIVADADHIEMIARAISADFEAGPVPVARREHIIRMKRSCDSKQDRADIEALENDED